MDPVPYEIQEEDIDEVLDAYEPTGGGAWSEDERREARDHVLKNVVELDEIVRSASEDPSDALGEAGDRMGQEAERPGERAPARREMALAAIEDMLIRDGFIDISADEERVFPVTGHGGPERGEP
ncbi:MAG: hypothetical protein ACOCVZ_02480 [Gemmatimonadota bacterium]